MARAHAACDRRQLGRARWRQLANGTIDNRLLGSTLGSVLREVNMLDLVGRGGTSQVQCFAARPDGITGSPPFVRWCSLRRCSPWMGWQREPWERDARSARAAERPGLPGPARGADADHWPVRSPSDSARPDSDCYTECGHRCGSRAGQHDADSGSIAGALGGKQLHGGSEGLRAALRRPAARPFPRHSQSGAAGGASAETEAEVPECGQCAEAAVPLRG